MSRSTRRPRLLTPDLEKYIERVFERAEATAAEKAAVAKALRDAWQSEGGKALRRFIDTRPARPTQLAYTQHLEDFLVWVTRHAGGIDLLDATPEDLARYERDVVDRVSRVTGRLLALKTRQERIRTVRTAYQFCVDEGLIDRSPARHIRIRGRAEPRRTFISDEDACALIAACGGARVSDARDRSLLTVLLHTGMRASEASALTWGAISEGRAPSITIEGKGRVVRTIPLSDEVRAELRAWATASGSTRRSSEYVWTRLEYRLAGETGRTLREGEWRRTSLPLTGLSVHSIVVKRASKAKLVHVTPHTLRRAYASKLKQLGVALDSIQRYLGHASILTTAGYFDPRDEDAVATVRKLHYGEVGAPKRRASKNGG